MAELKPHIDAQSEGGDLDEIDREGALKAIRVRNFDSILRDLEALRGEAVGGRLLDVGCAHGWFLERARADFRVYGIEPDEVVANRTLERGLPVRIGFFPEAINENERFDLIVFNDVLEHIPDLSSTLKACYQHLVEDGVLVINAPNSKGFIYHLTKLAAKAGFGSSFERMWQVGFPSPHLRYFSDSSVRKAVARNGFIFLRQRRLPSIVFKGLWKRVRYSKNASITKYVGAAAAAMALIPMLRLLPEDITVWYFRKGTR